MATHVLDRTGAVAAERPEKEQQSAAVPARALRRRISQASGTALEKLSHAIEYLTDEYTFEAGRSGEIDLEDPRVQAIQILMKLNRTVYFECPVEPPLLERLLGRLWRSR